jgi:hypothetical protein
MDVDKRRSMPDVYYVELHHSATEWTDGTLPDVYKFRITGKGWGERWIVHSVYVDKPAPPDWKLRTIRVLKQRINRALSELLEKEIPQWDSGLLAWGEDGML